MLVNSIKSNWINDNMYHVYFYRVCTPMNPFEKYRVYRLSYTTKDYIEYVDTINTVVRYLNIPNIEFLIATTYPEYSHLSIAGAYFYRAYIPYLILSHTHYAINAFGKSPKNS